MYCTKCGTANQDNNFRCTNCDEVIQSVAVATTNIGDNAGIRMLIPVGRSGWAIAAGYFGLFALMILPAPIALILGIVAVIDIKKNPHRHGMGRAIFGIVMGTLFSIPLVIMFFAMLFS